MTTAKEILTHKGSQVVTIEPQARVLDAARLMNQHKIGSLVVTQDEQVIGIFTERDVLKRVVAQHLDPAATQVGDVMTLQVACCRLETSIQEARTVMRNRRIRHLPVVDQDGKLQGMVSIGDLNAWDLNGQEQTIHFLHEYLYGQA